MIDTIIIVWLGAITGYLLVKDLPKIRIAKKDKPPKPPKPYTCPHGRISTQAVYMVKGQKRTLCKYCYNKEGVVQDVPKHDLPRL